MIIEDNSNNFVCILLADDNNNNIKTIDSNNGADLLNYDVNANNDWIEQMAKELMTDINTL